MYCYLYVQIRNAPCRSPPLPNAICFQGGVGYQISRVKNCKLIDDGLPGMPSKVDCTKIFEKFHDEIDKKQSKKFFYQECIRKYSAIFCRDLFGSIFQDFSRNSFTDTFMNSSKNIPEIFKMLLPRILTSTIPSELFQESIWDAF